MTVHVTVKIFCTTQYFQNVLKVAEEKLNMTPTLQLIAVTCQRQRQLEVLAVFSLQAGCA